MNKPQLVRSVILAVITLALAGISIRAQEPGQRGLSAAEVRSIKAHAERPEAVSFYAVTEDFEGSFDSIGANLAEFRKQFDEQKIKTIRNPTPIIVYYESPEEKSSFRYAVGLRLPKAVQVKAPLKGQEMSFARAVRHTHVGPPEQLGQVHATIQKSLRKPAKTKAGRVAAQPTTAFPVVVEIPDDPAKVSKARLRQTMIVPIE